MIPLHDDSPTRLLSLITVTVFFVCLNVPLLIRKTPNLNYSRPGPVLLDR